MALWLLGMGLADFRATSQGSGLGLWGFIVLLDVVESRPFGASDLRLILQGLSGVQRL